jgi:hypothetical protein
MSGHSKDIRWKGAGSRRPRPHGGYAILWCLITLMLFLTFGSFALELSWLRLSESRIRTAGEATALAAAGALHEGRALSAAIATDICSSNEGPNGPVILVSSADNESEDLTFGRWDAEAASFEPGLVAPDAVRARIMFNDEHPNGSVDMLLAGLLGMDRIELSTDVIAHKRPRFPVPASAWVLETIRPRSLFLRDSMLEVNGSLEVRSNSPESVTLLSGAMITSTLIDLQGGLNLDADEALRGMLREAPPTTPPPPAPDLNLNTLQNRIPVIDGPGQLVLAPGAYPNGLNASQGQYILEDGVYLFGSNGIRLTGQATLSGTNVIIVLDEGAGLELIGTEMSVRTSDRIGSRVNPDEIGLLAISKVKTNLNISEGAQLSVKGMIHCTKGLLKIKDGTISSSRLAIKLIEASSGSRLDFGPQTPHPVNLQLVK